MKAPHSSTWAKGDLLLSQMFGTATNSRLVKKMPSIPQQVPPWQPFVTVASPEGPIGVEHVLFLAQIEKLRVIIWTM